MLWVKQSHLGLFNLFDGANWGQNGQCALSLLAKRFIQSLQRLLQPRACTGALSLWQTTDTQCNHAVEPGRIEKQQGEEWSEVEGVRELKREAQQQQLKQLKQLKPPPPPTWCVLPDPVRMRAVVTARGRFASRSAMPSYDASCRGRTAPALCDTAPARAAGANVCDPVSANSRTMLRRSSLCCSSRHNSQENVEGGEMWLGGRKRGGDEKVLELFLRKRIQTR